MSGKKIHKTHFTQPEMPWKNKEEETVELKRERPIIFNAEMVRAILKGRKTQTRRVIKPQPKHSASYWICGKNGVWADGHGWQKLCPYGQPGGELWVRETWSAPGNDYEDCKPSELLRNWFKPEKLKYRATEQYGDAYYKWRPSIHMSRWMSRIQLEVVSVKVERVQDITEADAIAEGVRKLYRCPKWTEGEAIKSFIELWDSINKKQGFGWDENPWVWATGFKLIEVKNKSD